AAPRSLLRPRAAHATGTDYTARPVVPPELSERFVMRASALPRGSTLVYRPALLGRARLHYVQARQDVDEWREVAVLAPLGRGTERVPADPWASDATVYTGAGPELEGEPEEGASWAKLPAKAAQAKSYTSWQRVLKSYLYREHAMPFYRCRGLKLWSEPGEVEGDFKARVAPAAREHRDLQVAKLKSRFEPKVARLQERIRKAEQRIEVEKDQYSQARTSSIISWAGTILGAIFGRNVISKGNVSKAGTAARSSGRASQQKADIARAEADAKERREELEELEAQFESELDALQDKLDPSSYEVEAAPIRPRKSDIGAEPVILAWTPWTVDEAGIATPAFPGE
ncbi:MAG: hypothetical protein P1V36_16080, partial [Planctomycetota bacterium]|nr:hypothetical protein [Planctomycetota bacterium]